MAPGRGAASIGPQVEQVSRRFFHKPPSATGVSVIGIAR